MNYHEFLRFGVGQGASDVLLRAGSRPKLRIGGQLRNVEVPPLEAGPLLEFLGSVLPPGPGDLDRALASGARFTFAIEGLSRFRATLFEDLGAPGAALRVVPSRPRSLEDLGLPEVLRDVALSPRGLTLVVGSGGGGRTTTLAALLDQVNRHRSASVVAVASPVEFVHAPDQAILTNLELRPMPGLQRALRLAPDVVAVDELGWERRAALAVLDASESGRHVVVVAQAPDAIGALQRLMAIVRPEERADFKARLIAALSAIVGIRLATTREGKRRPVVEVFRAVHQTRQLIRENRLDDVARLMAAGQGGMQDIDRQLLELYRQGEISGTEALRLAIEPEDLAPELQAARRRSSP